MRARAVAAAEPGGADVLQAFLLDMEQLDQQRQVAVDAMHSHSSAELSTSKRRARRRSPTEDAPPPPKKKARGSWLRRKLELRALREEAESLAREVDFLQLRRVPEDLLQDVTQPASSQAKRTSELADAWEAAATSEKQRREAALAENARLKARLHAQVQATTAIRAILPPTSTNRLGSEDIFDVLEKSVNARVDELDDILTTMQTPLAVMDALDVKIRRDGEHPLAATVEFSNARVLPFDVGDVAKAIKFVANLGLSDGKASDRVIQRSTDVLASKAHLAMSLPDGSTAEMAVHCVMRWFHVAGGFVVLAESLTEWRAGVWTHTTRESGWFVGHRHPKASGDSKTPSISQVKFMMRVRPRHAALSEQDATSWPGHPVGDVVIPCVSKIITSRHQFVDNHLLDAALATERHTWSTEQPRETKRG